MKKRCLTNGNPNPNPKGGWGGGGYKSAIAPNYESSSPKGFNS